MLKKLQVVAFLILFLNSSLALWPQPNKISYGEKENSVLNLQNQSLFLQITQKNEQQTNNVKNSNQIPQQVLSKFEKKFDQYLELISKKLNQKTKQIINDQQNNTLLQKVQKKYPLVIKIEDLHYFKINQNTDESYKLNIDENQTEIIANNYYGFLRAIETFSQLIDANYQINQIPIQIEDEPYMQYRGIMLDCARHFMPVSTILRTIDAMQYNKMNALHLHLADDESFPLYISEEPKVTELGAYNKESIYSLEDIKTILEHGNQAGVRIIPEIDSPSHARSWALMEKYANCNIICPGAEHYNGQLDITLDLTYELVEKIVNSTQNLFTDDYIHLGGDEVINSCYDKRPSIKTWMKNKGMDTSNYIGLQKYYRAQQKKMLKKGKSSVYWCNEQLNIPPTEDQILQYWGQYENIDMLLDVPNKIIISSEDKLYINMGQGFVFGNSFGSYLTWKTVYDFEPLPKGYTKDRILGAEACLWSEVNNEFTVDNNLWIRGSALAERLWSQQKDTTESLVTRLDQMQKDLVKRGIEAAPATSQFCSKYPSKCF